MYISIALVLCSWILIYAGGSLQLDRIIVERLKVMRELMELQKEAAQNTQKISFKVYCNACNACNEAYKLDKTKKDASQTKDLENRGSKSNSVASKDRKSSDQKTPVEPQKEEEFPIHRISFYGLINSNEPSRLEDGFLRLWEDVLLEGRPISKEEKRRFAKEVLKGLRKIDLKKESDDCYLETLQFEKSADRELYCSMLRSNPSPVDFITLKKRKISFFNLDPRVLKALFPQVSCEDLERLRKKTDKTLSVEVQPELEKLLGQSIEGSQDPLFKALEFNASNARDFSCYQSISKHGGMRLWRVSRM